jgi:hypothetical protein
MSWKMVVVVYLKELPQYSLGETEGTREIPIRIAGNTE